MKTHSALPYLIATALFLSAASVQAQHEHEHQHENEQAATHGHEEHAGSGLSLNNGAQWETDEALRHGMLEIRAEVNSVAPAFEAGQISQAQAQQLSQTVQDSVNAMIAQCKLEPAADESLHSILGMLLSGAATLESSPMSAQGLPALKDALQTYGEYFNHTGWQGDDHGAHAQ